MSTPAFDQDGFTVIRPDPAAGERFKVLNDAPVGEGEDADLLETTQVARGLADLVIASRASAPFTLAVDAAWGMGKSSLMRRLEATLAAEPAVSVVWFNAWTSGRASALEGLIKSVMLRFDRNVIRRTVRSVSRRTHLFGLLRASMLVASSFFGLRRVVDEIWRTLAVDAQSRNQIKGVLRNMFAEWIKDEGTVDQRRLLVVFIDDLDRCANERIIEVCEAIKLYLDVPGVVFVLACDQSVLWRATRDSMGTGEAAGSIEYLEKIIQINYRIAAPSTALALRLVNGYLERSGTSRLFDESMKSVIIERSGRNPRRIKRLLNSFVLEYHLNRSWDEIGVENLVKIVMLQHFYPTFYQILTNPRDADPISEFQKYQEFRAAVRQGGQLDMQRWRGLFIGKGIKPPAGDPSDEALSQYLGALEGELPAEFPALAADRDFVALIQSFDGPINSNQLRRLLRKPLTQSPAMTYGSTNPNYYDVPVDNIFAEPRRRLSISLALDADEAPEQARGQDGGTVAGLKVLWIDDHPETNTVLAKFLTDRGASITLATDRATAIAAIARVRPDVILSDFTRHGDVNAGIDDLEHLRVEQHFDGLVIFCSGQPTPERRRRADELRAVGPTNDEHQIVHWLSLIASEKAGVPRKTDSPDEESGRALPGSR